MRYRAGAPWTTAEDERLVRGLLDGLTVDDLAHAHGRTVGAVAARLSHMVPGPSDPDNADVTSEPAVPRGRAKRVEWLREELIAAPGYDWRAQLTHTLGAYERPWTPEEDARVTHAWETAERLEDVSAAVGVEGHLVVRRLIQLGLAADFVGRHRSLPKQPGQRRRRATTPGAQRGKDQGPSSRPTGGR